MTDPVAILPFASALGCGLVAGIFFAFSNFVMKALARVPPAQGIAAMQAINVVVLNRWFFAVFFGTAVCCLALAILSFVRWQKPGTGFVLVGALLYLIGTILVTIVCNVPLNDALAAVDPSSADGGRVWTNYLKSWTAWNHVRTAAAVAAAASLTVGLCRASSPVDPARSETSSSPMSATLPHKSDDWPKVFEQRLNAGDVDAVMTLYESDARQADGSWKSIMGDPNARESTAKSSGSPAGP